MGLFGWHQCTAEGCTATLFVPLFDSPRFNKHRTPERVAEWEAYEAAAAEWHTTPHGYGERCPAHRDTAVPT